MGRGDVDENARFSRVTAMSSPFLKLIPEIAERIFYRNFHLSRHRYQLEPWMLKTNIAIITDCEAAPPARQHTTPHIEWIYLQQDDTFQNGDEYGWPDFRFVIGTKQTVFKAGDTIPAHVMCYQPRRRKTPQYTPVVRSCHHVLDNQTGGNVTVAIDTDCPVHGSKYQI